MSEVFGIPQAIMLSVPDGCLPEPETVNYYTLAKERKIYIDYDIDENILDLQKKLLQWNMEDKGKPREERKPIYIYIMSSGGDLNYMWSVIDSIEISQTPVITINMGLAASAAGLIFMAGHERYMLRRSKVLIHKGAATVGGDAQKVQDFLEDYKKDLNKMKEYVLERTNIPKSTMSRKQNNDWVLDSDYCLEHGVCTRIIDSMEDIV